MTNDKEKPVIRQMEEKDIDSILKIDKKISSLERAFTYENLFNSLIGGEIASSFVAEIDKQVVGFVMATMTYVPEEVTLGCMINIIGVDPDYRRRGIAGMLIEALVDACHLKGIKMIRIMVDQHDSLFKRLFESLEFRRGNMVEYSLTL